MFLSGIHRIDQLSRARVTGPIGRRRAIAADLYEQCFDLPDDECDFFQEQLLFRLVSSQLTFKRTYRDRFQKFDEELRPYLHAYRDNKSGVLSVHDAGASDGRTSCSFHDLVAACLGPQTLFTASDRDVSLATMQTENGRRYIFDARGDCIQVVSPPFVINMGKAPMSRALLVNRLAKRVYERDRLKSKEIIPSGGAGGSKKITMICREFRALQEASDGVRFDEYDLLSGPTETVDVFRVMNVLNWSYFDKSQLLAMVSNLKRSLKEGGLLITGTNENRGSPVNGGIYCRKGNDFSIVMERGQGSPIRDLILGSD